MNKKILYIDMDGVIVDFESALKKMTPEILAEYKGREDEIPDLFSKMDPLPGAIEAITELAPHFDLYLLSTAPWLNPSSWTDKIRWVHHHFGSAKNSLFYKRLIITHNKHLNHGDFLIDDRLKNGSESFTGQLIHYGSPGFPDWVAVKGYLLERM